MAGDVGISSHRTMYKNLMKKNLSLFSETEIGFFLSFKESQYSLRRERIEEYCSKRDQKFGKKIVKSSLIYDDVDGVSYCQIAKVASSSWCNHFIKLGKLDLFWSMLGCLTIKYWTNLQWVNKKTLFTLSKWYKAFSQQMSVTERTEDIVTPFKCWLPSYGRLQRRNVYLINEKTNVISQSLMRH